MKKVTLTIEEDAQGDITFELNAMPEFSEPLSKVEKIGFWLLELGVKMLLPVGGTIG